jgi:hypothetical protein
MEHTMVHFALALLVLTYTFPQQPPEKRLLSYKEYAKLQHDVPYVLEFKVGNGALLLFGCQHAFDPANPQLTDIEKEWARFKPDIAYNEGGNPPGLSSRKTAIEKYAEPGLVRHLAARDAVPVATFEPPDEAEIKELTKRYSAEQIKVFYLLRSYLTFRQAKHEQTADAFMTAQMNDPQWKAQGLDQAARSIEELNAACGRVFNGLKDWKQVPDDWFDPTRNDQYTNEVQNDSGMFRDRHIFQVLTKRAMRGDRVFAVIGASHVPAMEPALEAALGKPIMKRDGARITTR